ncbi:MAG: hypothetical protein HKN33_13605 [Pyrinomonadaceae bacterium]|nr:hypothetical protein [Pyrinomonadaceae bacterium]
MKFEVKFWEEKNMMRGKHISTLVIDIGRIYDDWETASSDPKLFVIGNEGKGLASLEKYGSMYLYEHVVSTKPLLLCNWTHKTGKLWVGLRGDGTIYKTKPSHWKNTHFQCEVTKKL